MIALEKFIREHDNWEEILTKEPYFLKVSRDGEYIMFKYDQIKGSDFNIPLVKNARGIIFREADWTCVCHPFDKFGNYGEEYCPDINWKKCSVQQKIDGSLIKVWYDNGKWHISTNGLIDAFKAPVDHNPMKIETFGDLFCYELKFCGAIDSFEKLGKSLDEDYTYMFELITEYNRVVVPAENYESSIYLLGARNIKTNEEVDLDGSYLSQVFYMPKRYNLHTLDEVVKAAAELPWDEEGYVVCDNKFNRVKIKSPEYVKAHYGRTNGNVSLLRIIALILNNETAEFLVYASDYADIVANVEKAMQEFKEKMAKTVIELTPESFATRKELAEKVKTYPKHYQAFLFRYDNLDSAFERLRPSQWKDIFDIEGVLKNEN